MKQGKTFAGRSFVIASLLAASALAAPQVAQAAPGRESQLEDRLNKLEAELASLRAQLNEAKAAAAAPAPVSVAAAQQSADEAKAQAALAVRTAEAAKAKSEQVAVKQADAETKETKKFGFRSGNSTVTLSGYVKLLASTSRYSGGDDPTNTLGRDIYLPQNVPVYNPASPTSATRVTDFSAKQTRFWVDASTKLGQHDLKAYIEFDFQAAPGTPMASGQGTQRTTNAYDLAMRRAFIQYDRWTFGQDFTNFTPVSVLPESTDYVGGIDGLIFIRQPQVRYTAPVGKGTTLTMAVENPETASATVGAPALVENGEDHAPDGTVRLEHVGKFGLVDLSFIARELRVDNAKVAAAHVVDSRFGWGVSVASKLFLNEKHNSDLRLEATYGDGLGRYLGLNFGPDAVLMANGKLGNVRNLGLFGAAHIALTDKWRVNVIGSYQYISYAGYIDRTAAGIANFNKQAWSGAANIFYSPVKNLDFGLEYRHGHRELVNGLNGSVDRMEVAAKYSF